MSSLSYWSRLPGIGLWWSRESGIALNPRARCSSLRDVLEITLGVPVSFKAYSLMEGHWPPWEDSKRAWHEYTLQTRGEMSNSTAAAVDSAYLLQHTISSLDLM